MCVHVIGRPLFSNTNETSSSQRPGSLNSHQEQRTDCRLNVYVLITSLLFSMELPHPTEDRKTFGSGKADNNFSVFVPPRYYKKYPPINHKSSIIKMWVCMRVQAGVYAWICVWTKMCVCLFGGNERRISIAFTLNNGANQSLGSSLIKRWARCTRVHSRELMEEYNQMQINAIINCFYKDSLSEPLVQKQPWTMKNKKSFPKTI